MHKSKSKFGLLEDVLILGQSKRGKTIEDIEGTTGIKIFKSKNCFPAGIQFQTTNFDYL